MIVITLTKEKGMYTVQISGVPEWLCELQLKRHFSRFGKIKSSTLLLDSKLYFTGKAKIVFELEAAAQDALSLDGTKLDGARLQVEPVLESESE